MECASCVVPSYGGRNNREGFCNACRQQAVHKSYYLVLREPDDTLRPFVALDDPEQLVEYAARLERQGLAHLILAWDPACEVFSHFADSLPPADELTPAPAR